MRPRSSLITALFFLALAATPAFAKNVSVGIYAVVDEVTFEPQGSAPNLVRISGVFVVPVPISSGLYRPPQRGYLYFRLRPGMEQAIRKDWSQLKAVAGTGQVVGFAQYWVWVPPNPNDRLSNMYHSLEARVRTEEDVAPPDEYPIPNAKGIVRHREPTDPDFDKIAAELKKAQRH